MDPSAPVVQSYVRAVARGDLAAAMGPSFAHSPAQTWAAHANATFNWVQGHYAGTPDGSVSAYGGEVAVCFDPGGGRCATLSDFRVYDGELYSFAWEGVEITSHASSAPSVTPLRGGGEVSHYASYLNRDGRLTVHSYLRAGDVDLWVYPQEVEYLVDGETLWAASSTESFALSPGEEAVVTHVIDDAAWNGLLRWTIESERGVFQPELTVAGPVLEY